MVIGIPIKTSISTGPNKNIFDIYKYQYFSTVCYINMNQNDLNNHYIALICCILVLLFLLMNCKNKKDGFDSKPSELQKQKFTDEIIKNRSDFVSDMYSAREKMPWLDAITYEDVRNLIRENNFNKESILNILN
jgi:hypothetical protein